LVTKMRRAYRVYQEKQRRTQIAHKFIDGHYYVTMHNGENHVLLSPQGYARQKDCRAAAKRIDKRAGCMLGSTLIRLLTASK
jgi:hypothetical protein